MAWEKARGDNEDPSLFVEEIRPRLAKVPLSEMMRATGLSRPYCAMIRRGERVPHSRHWETIQKLCESS